MNDDPRHTLRPAQRRAIFPLRPSALEVPLDPAAYAHEPTPLAAQAVVAALSKISEERMAPFIHPASEFRDDVVEVTVDLSDPEVKPTIALVPKPPAPRLQSVPVKPKAKGKGKGSGGRRRGPDGKFLPDA